MGLRDVRYETIKPMLNEGKIQTFSDIFKFIKKSIVAADLGKNSNRFNELIERVEDFQVKELLRIALFCNLTSTEMFRLVDNELIKKNQLKL